MTIYITPETQTAFQAHLNEAVDWDLSGAPILRRNTYPYTLGMGEVTFTAGYQAGKAAALVLAGQANEWKEAVLDELAAHAIDAPAGMSPREIVAVLLETNSKMAKDPAINAPTAGWQLVPVEPTNDMVECGLMAACCLVTKYSRKDFANAYRGMLSAAPKEQSNG